MRLSFDYFFFNDTATTEIYTLSLHDALPICETVFAVADALRRRSVPFVFATGYDRASVPDAYLDVPRWEKPFRPEELRSEEHTSELHSRQYLVCRLLLEKKKINNIQNTVITT